MSGPSADQPGSGLLTATGVAVAVMVAGIILDYRWHRVHDSADSAADLVVSHWLIWLGLVVVIAVASVGARRFPSSWHSGWRLLLIGGIAYAAIELFHIVSHEIGRAEALATGLAQLGKAAVLLGAITTAVHARRLRRQPTPRSRPTDQPRASDGP